MATSKNQVSFKNATITLEDGKYIITEVKKDTMKVYNLSDQLSAFEGIENLTLSISCDKEIIAIEEITDED